jgi:hypothetical protein
MWTSYAVGEAGLDAEHLSQQGRQMNSLRYDYRLLQQQCRTDDSFTALNGFMKLPQYSISLSSFLKAGSYRARFANTRYWCTDQWETHNWNALALAPAVTMGSSHNKGGNGMDIKGVNVTKSVFAEPFNNNNKQSAMIREDMIDT